jgi:SPP1 gp7 family putative phage head morphogenesis protein
METSFQARPHVEAIALIKGKPVVSSEIFQALLPEIRSRVFTISGIESANVIQAVREEVAALPAGQTWNKCKNNIAALLEPYLGEEVAKDRATFLLRRHCFQAFQVYNWRLAQEDVDTTHLQYLATEDEEVRPTHKALNGIVLPKDDTFWDEHYPPWEENCRCHTRSMNPDFVMMEKEADENRLSEEKLVLEGSLLTKLREGTLIRGTRTFDVTPDSSPDAYRFHPEHLTIPLEELKNRYDLEVWSRFRDTAQRAIMDNGISLWEWLGGKKTVGHQ